MNTKLSWLTFSLKQLVKHGPQALKISALCEAKSVTKGSFYHHFTNRQQFIEALMEYWYQQTTLNFIEQANVEQEPLKRLEKLDLLIDSYNIEAEMHIRAWALQEKTISKHFIRIDQQRQQYLQSCYQELGIKPELAEDIAMMAYAQFLGFQQMSPKPSQDTVNRLAVLAMQTFLEVK